MYAAVDPLHAVLIAYHLGPNYHVWMKSATIDFRRPARSDLTARIRVETHEFAELREALKTNDKIDRVFLLSLINADGEISADVKVTVHIRNRRSHEPPMTKVVFS